MSSTMSRRAPAIMVKELAVTVVTRCGAVERSGDANLVVFRQRDLMIAYTTPFNRARRLSAGEKYELTLRGDRLALSPYAIEIWAGGQGRVFTAAWGANSELLVPRYKPGQWNGTLEAVHEQACQTRIGEHAHPDRTALHRLQHLERENARLRQTISELAGTIPSAPGAWA